MQKSTQESRTGRRKSVASHIVSEEEKFKKVMKLRLQRIGEKACCDDHNSAPMYVGDQRLACCAGSGSSCKIKELQFLAAERKRVSELAYKYRVDYAKLVLRHLELERQLARAHEEIGDLQEKNSQLEDQLDSKRVKIDESLYAPYDIFPPMRKIEPTTVVNIHNTTNIMNVNFIGSETIRKKAVDLLVGACKPQGNLIASVIDLLKTEKTPENLKLLELSAADPPAFQNAVVDNLTPSISSVPVELQATVANGLRKAGSPLPS